MPTEKFKRKLAAILSADGKRYSRLMGEDEERTIRILNAYLEVITGFVQRHRGRVVATGAIASWRSVPGWWMLCGVRRGSRKSFGIGIRNCRKKRMEFRIGINLGDVVAGGDNIWGDGGNVFARVQSSAEAGGISISGTAYDHVKKKLVLGYEYLG